MYGGPPIYSLLYVQYNTYPHYIHSPPYSTFHCNTRPYLLTLVYVH